MDLRPRRLFLAALAGGVLAGALAAAPLPREPEAVTVTAVRSPSWRQLLQLPYGESAVGRNAYREPSELVRKIEAEQPRAQESWNGAFVLSGYDIFRLDCLACHGADGMGLPPEINSVIGPVRASTVVGLKRQLAERGAEVDEELVKTLAAQGEAALRTRLHKGGTKMPPFEYLSPAEIEALLGYLRELAGVAENDKPRPTLVVPSTRVGELIVKSTCHICHDAVGQGRSILFSPEAQGRPIPLLPSLASWPRERSVEEVVQKVRLGVTPQPAPFSGSGKMPKFPYLTPIEVQAAYFYLEQFPPEP